MAASRRRGPGRRARLAGLALACAALACANLDAAGIGQVLGAAGLGGGTALDESTIVAGLKQALEVGARNSVDLTSREGGFWRNPSIRIPMPEKLEGFANGLRRVGFAPQVDEFELTMNRAAESAAGEALPVFFGAIGSMSFADARGILQGGDTAATDYFRRATSDELRRRFEPIVGQSMQAVGAARAYDQLLESWRAVPLLPRPSLDLNDYVTERGLDGLFLVLGQEEQKIRTDPGARVTELLQRVFASP